MYKFIRSVLFLFDAEKVHHFAMNALRLLCSNGLAKKWIQKKYQPGAGNKVTTIFNKPFLNKVGLAAGFDKNAKYLNELQALGFGFVEIGTVTPLPQAGNDTPRLFRLPKDKALINRMGFNNDGVEAVAARLKEWQLKNDSATNSKNSLIIGGNIGKNKVTPNDDAWLDYEKCFIALHDWVDYFVVNVSSPNTPGLRALQEKESLRKILTNLQQVNASKNISRPILLKIAPDLTIEQVDDVISLAKEINLDGLVVANTTINRDGLLTPQADLNKIGAGGLSGQPLKKQSTQLVQYIYQQTNGQIPIIASGGIFTGPDALEKIKAGASLVQVWTGFIYEGPAIIKNIANHITAQL
ncbi:MAG: quinone-dependent dihydroorotate dehydrogenase [Bacteroidetes bacterium]|nr:quinone-dependent dihydroorotate dehydrogenase [Bacteroidota bacterium]MBS1758432.1 quinone-dependent dihydroorotate dehydrogenase [Bacteroidota bacterium]